MQKLDHGDGRYGESHPRQSAIDEHLNRRWRVEGMADDPKEFCDEDLCIDGNAQQHTYDEQRARQAKTMTTKSARNPALKNMSQ